MTLFVMFCMLVIGFLAGILFTVAFVAYLETKVDEEKKFKSEHGPEYMSRINTQEGIDYHNRRD